MTVCAVVYPIMSHPDSSAPAEDMTPAPVAKRVRRISSKPAKHAAVPDMPDEAAPAASAPAEPKPAPWAEPEVIEGASSGEHSKRKRKRKRKGKGGASHNSGSSTYPESPGETDGPPPASARSTEKAAEPAKDPSAPPKSHAPRIAHDSKVISKMSWKLYQGEIGEEGIALIDDHDARDLARRCFRLAEIFLDEQARRGR